MRKAKESGESVTFCGWGVTLFFVDALNLACRWDMIAALRCSHGSCMVFHNRAFEYRLVFTLQRNGHSYSIICDSKGKVGHSIAAKEVLRWARDKDLDFSLDDARKLIEAIVEFD